MMSDPDKLFRTVTDFTIFDNNLISHAREVFDDYIEKGIILSYDFDHHKVEISSFHVNKVHFGPIFARKKFLVIKLFFR